LGRNLVSQASKGRRAKPKATASGTKQVIVKPVNIDFPPEYDVTLTRSSAASISNRILVRSLSGAGGASSNVSLRSRSDANPQGQRLKPVNAELQVGRDTGTVRGRTSSHSREKLESNSVWSAPKYQSSSHRSVIERRSQASAVIKPDAARSKLNGIATSDDLLRLSGSSISSSLWRQQKSFTSTDASSSELRKAAESAGAIKVGSPPGLPTRRSIATGANDMGSRTLLPKLPIRTTEYSGKV
jgi:hypothetical protein